MLTRRALFGFVLLFSLGSIVTLAPSAHAGQPFSPAALAAAKASDGPVLVEVHADWCPVCAKQKPIMSELLSLPRFKGFQVLTVDFDSQKDALRALGVQYQSTFVVFKGNREMARSTGVTDKDALAAMLAKGI